jgi:peroxiredoxin
MVKLKKIKLLLALAIISLVLGMGEAALASEIILNDLGGQAVNISSYQGKPVILFFWTTWCPYCRMELKKLNQGYAQITKEGIVLLGVNVSEPEYKVRRFFKGYLLHFRMLLDKYGLLADKYELLGVPTYIFLDKAGKVISQAQRLPENYKNLLFRQVIK